jgi:DNA-binding MarR family transcriptional regulator
MYYRSMKAKQHEVADMMTALMTVIRSTERAQRKGDASRLRILASIAGHTKSTPKAISEDLGVHASSITRQVQALEDDGHVSIAADQQDGRSYRLKLTPAGTTELVRLRQIGLDRWSTFVAKWDAEEVRTLASLLNKLEHSKQETGPRPTASKRNWRKK